MFCENAGVALGGRFTRWGAEGGLERVGEMVLWYRLCRDHGGKGERSNQPELINKPSSETIGAVLRPFNSFSPSAESFKIGDATKSRVIPCGSQSSMDLT